jgi:predicted  nucleic acid-binding Zn-ribbon protein
MSGPAAALRELHRLRRLAKDLQDEIERGPRLVKAQMSKVKQRQDTLAQAQEDVKKRKVATHEKETELKDLQLQIKKYEEQRNKTSSKKEYDALNAEIAVAKHKCTRIEDRILELMGDADSAAAQLPELVAAVEQAKQDVAKYESELQEKSSGLAEELKKTQQGLTDTEAALPPEVREPYRRLVAARGEDAMAAVVDRNCAACYTGITAQNYHDLANQQLIHCKSCGRILYLAE